MTLESLFIKGVFKLSKRGSLGADGRHEQCVRQGDIRHGLLWRVKPLSVSLSMPGGRGMKDTQGALICFRLTCEPHPDVSRAYIIAPEGAARKVDAVMEGRQVFYWRSVVQV